jgi:Fur family transcriptional regulator, stress-responsive regulator
MAKDALAVPTLAHRLRQAGLRATRPRLLAYQVLVERPGHHSVDDLADELRARGHPFPRTSLYNVVEALCRVGLATCAGTGPGRALYEVAGVPHHHFVCRACAVVIDVPCAAVTTPCLTALDELPGKVDDAQVVYWGLCALCASGESQVAQEPSLEQVL